MRAFAWMLTTVLLLVLLPGCGSDKDKGVYRHKDMPKAGTTEPEKEK